MRRALVHVTNTSALRGTDATHKLASWVGVASGLDQILAHSLASDDGVGDVAAEWVTLAFSSGFCFATFAADVGRSIPHAVRIVSAGNLHRVAPTATRAASER
jgi:hypothetical protein